MAHVALAWLLHQPGVVSVLAGARNADQMNQNARAAVLKLPSEIAAELAEATDDLKQKLGPAADMWQPESESRVR